MLDQLILAAEALVAAIQADAAQSGGLLSRATIRKADELRILTLRYRDENSSFGEAGRS